MRLSRQSAITKLSSSESPINTIGQLNPLKSKFWGGGNATSLVIDAKFFLWPLKFNDNILDLVFPEFKTALNSFTSRFDTVTVISDLKNYPISDHLHFRSAYSYLKESATVLTIFEAEQLYNIYKQGSFKDECWYALKIEEEDHFLVNFQRGISLADLMNAVGKKMNRSIDHLTAMDPVTGNALDSKMILDARLSSIFFRKVKSRYDIPFPLWGMKHSVKLKEISSPENSLAPCCNCLGCVSVCPSGIAPNILYHLLLNDDVEDIDKYDITSCIRCGRCSSVCPSNIPLYSGIDGYLQIREKEEIDENT